MRGRSKREFEAEMAAREWQADWQSRTAGVDEAFAKLAAERRRKEQADADQR